MKLSTPEKTLLIEVTAVQPQGDGFLIEGTIMGAMPMKAILTSAELRRGYKLINWAVIRRGMAMLLGLSKQSPTKTK